MNILDENIRDDQWRELRRQRIVVCKIGRDIARKGVKDDRIISLLHQQNRPTFFTRDADFFDRDLCHERYCLVHLAVDQKLVAEYVRRVLRHPALDSKAKRMGLVIRVDESGLSIWRVHATKGIQPIWK
jgi:hypothetical protein